MKNLDFRVQFVLTAERVAVELNCSIASAEAALTEEFSKTVVMRINEAARAAILQSVRELPVIVIAPQIPEGGIVVQ